jgi:hypothetical protein
MRSEAVRVQFSNAFGRHARRPPGASVDLTRPARGIVKRGHLLDDAREGDRINLQTPESAWRNRRNSPAARSASTTCGASRRVRSVVSTRFAMMDPTSRAAATMCSSIATPVGDKESTEATVYSDGIVISNSSEAEAGTLSYGPHTQVRREEGVRTDRANATLSATRPARPLRQLHDSRRARAPGEASCCSTSRKLAECAFVHLLRARSLPSPYVRC